VKIADAVTMPTANDLRAVKGVFMEQRLGFFEVQRVGGELSLILNDEHKNYLNEYHFTLSY
jgi:hypothetical protein